MTQDPYAAPTSNIESAPTREGTPGTGTFDIGLTISDGWQNTIQNIGPMIGVFIVGFLVTILMYVTIIGIFIGLPVLMYGFIKFFLNTHDGKGDFGDLFSGFSNYGANLGKMLVFGILMILIFAAGGSVQYIGMAMDDGSVTLIGSLIGMVFQLVVGVRLYWAPYFIVDRDMSATEAIGASWQASSGNWLKMFLLYLMAAVVTVLGILALGVGVLIAIPMTYMMFASSYRQCAGTPAR
jgi:uncharacterized membrane protein